ncbi:MAG: MFS transporter [Odoribacteraceae bacterium]|jgi:dipeptide/tripeptide permease|nr:MFS transporter [Odoribacteraceae bacterium]
MNVFKRFSRVFWVANVLELFERWAWYGFFMLFANYLTGSSDTGGLEFTQAQKGLLMGVGTGILYFLPVLTGAIADRYGYKRVLLFAFLVYASAFLLLPLFSSFTAVFLMYLYLAVGAALFKPVISATVSKTTDERSASIGFGIYYMMVNIGAFFGPVVTLLFNEDYRVVFYISAGVILLNLILLLFYKEPGRRERRAPGPLSTTVGEIFRNMFSIVKDTRFLLFLLIVAGFWTMYNQLFFTLPVFISQWVDTRALYDFFSHHLPFISHHYSPAPGVIDAEFVTNFDAFYIILLQVVISTAIMRLKPLKSMISGFLVCSIGMALTLFSQDVLFTLVAMLVFAVGEMAGSPKITEYIGAIAPAEKKALYMGYSFIPVFLGNVFAGLISGSVYQRMSDKVTIVRDYARQQGFSVPDGVSQGEYFDEVARQAGLSGQELTNLLWDTYSPSSIWIVVLTIGLVASASLFIYDRYKGSGNNQGSRR